MPGRRKPQENATQKAIWWHFLLVSSVLACDLLQSYVRLRFPNLLEPWVALTIDGILSIFLVANILVLNLRATCILILLAWESVTETMSRLFARRKLRNRSPEIVRADSFNTDVETSFLLAQGLAGSWVPASPPKMCIDAPLSSSLLGLQILPVNQRGGWFSFVFSSNGWTVSPPRNASPRWDEPPRDVYQGCTDF
jgi:hypothetical protein